MTDSTRIFSANDLDAAYHQQAHQQANRSTWFKWLCLLLVLLAVNVFLWFDSKSAAPLLSDGSQQPLQSNLAPNKIMPRSDTTVALVLDNPMIPTALPTSASTETSACMLWSFPNNADLKRADLLLSEQGWTGFVSEQALEPISYMVFTGPFDDKSELNAKLKVIEKMKLQDYRALPTGAISLGVLSTPEAAKALAQTLTARGLLGVKTGERPNRVQRTRYRFEGLSLDSLKALNGLGVNLGTLSTCP